MARRRPGRGPRRRREALRRAPEGRECARPGLRVFVCVLHLSLSLSQAGRVEQILGPGPSAPCRRGGPREAAGAPVHPISVLIWLFLLLVVLVVLLFIVVLLCYVVYLPAKIVPAKTRRLNISGKFPMDMDLHLLEDTRARSHGIDQKTGVSRRGGRQTFPKWGGCFRFQQSHLLVWRTAERWVWTTPIYAQPPC